MNPITHCLSQFANSVVVFTLAMGTALAQTEPAKISSEIGDPARWYQEDLTPHARFQTSKKEAAAAYKEAVIDCKQLELSSRSNCMHDARSQMMQDVESAKKKLMPNTPNGK